MSNKYSLGGYRIALQAKSRKTLMVEGKEDKELFARLRHASVPSMPFDIDAADILQDNLLSGLGAKAKIDCLLESITEGSPIRKKFRAFLDREWENLVDRSSGDPLPWTPPQISDLRFTTTGHSVENYGFSFDFICSYISHFGSDLPTSQMKMTLQSCFASLLQFAAAFSEIARRRGMVSKCADIVRLSDIALNELTFSLDQRFSERLSTRGISDGDIFVADVARECAGKWSVLPLSSECHQHSHGHIGEMLIWVGVAKIAENMGVEESLCVQLAYGRRDERRRFWHTWLTSIAPANITPMDRVFSYQESV